MTPDDLKRAGEVWRGLSDRERNICVAIEMARNGIRGADSIARFLGYRPAISGRLAVSSTLRVLQRKGIVGRIPPQDQWDHAAYFTNEPFGEFARTGAHP